MLAEHCAFLRTIYMKDKRYSIQRGSVESNFAVWVLGEGILPSRKLILGSVMHMPV